MNEQCKQKVYVKDTYRYTGRKGGFEMHYTERRCKRRANSYDGYCWQHPWGKA